MRNLSKLILFCVPLLLNACANIPMPMPKNDIVLPASKSAALCENDQAKVYIGYPTANIGECTVASSDKFIFTMNPENIPINDSPWYGFRIDPKVEGNVDIRFKYENGSHRYIPKISYDGTHWDVIPPRRIRMHRDESVTLKLTTLNQPFYISAQEIFTADAHDRWSEKIATLPFVTLSQIGQSKDGFPISMLEAQTEPEVAKPFVVFVGRQHPPEVTGALALMPFVEKILGEDLLAVKFREHFNVMIVPNMNPDGVTAGHWRSNKNGIDLNRDWGPFTQPETQAVHGALKRFEGGQDRVAFFLDFHSTKRNLLYTQAGEEPTSPPMFAKDWLEAVDARLNDDVYSFSHEARHNSGKPISKNYMYDTHGISSITYEVGDNTDRTAITLSARVFAEEMMTLLLKHEMNQ